MNVVLSVFVGVLKKHTAESTLLAALTKEHELRVREYHDARAIGENPKSCCRCCGKVCENNGKE